MVDYRDIGTIEGGTAALVPIELDDFTQVYKATHDGTQRLPYRNRSFISFSYGGKVIEDFNLIAITENNAISRNTYAPFEDNITESEIYDGQIYWSSHFNANTLTLPLFTDGMTDLQFDDFKKWFCPGEIRELILAEHPNRGIMARIAEPPAIELLPFEKKITRKIGGKEVQVSTTLYKGKVTVSFVMDDPYWYSLTNILDIVTSTDDENSNDEESDTYIKHYHSGNWIDANGQVKTIMTDADALKIIVEDNVLTSNMFGKFLPSQGEQAPNFKMFLGTKSMFHAAQNNKVGTAIVGTSRIGESSLDILEVVENLNLGEDEACYFYYGGTAPCKPTIMFTIMPKISEGAGAMLGYMVTPYNTIAAAANSELPAYNTITVKSINEQYFKITTPNIWSGYNQALQIFKTAGDGSNLSWEELRIILRDNVKHFAPRNYAMKVIDDIRGDSTHTSAYSLTQAIVAMEKFLKDDNSVCFSGQFVFNGQTGRATGTFKYRDRYDDIQTLEEDVGDMVKSDYLIIKDRNYLNEDGCIDQWSEEHPEYSYKFTHDVDTGLNECNFEYKYLYF